MMMARKMRERESRWLSYIHDIGIMAGIVEKKIMMVAMEIPITSKKDIFIAEM